MRMSKNLKGGGGWFLDKTWKYVGSLDIFFFFFLQMFDHLKGKTGSCCFTYLWLEPVLLGSQSKSCYSDKLHVLCVVK